MLFLFTMFCLCINFITKYYHQPLAVIFNQYPLYTNIIPDLLQYIHLFIFLVSEQIMTNIILIFQVLKFGMELLKKLLSQNLIHEQHQELNFILSYQFFSFTLHTHNPHKSLVHSLMLSLFVLYQYCLFLFFSFLFLFLVMSTCTYIFN